MVCLSWSKLVQRSKVNNPAGFTIWFGGYYHAMTPCDWVIDWHFFQHSQITIIIQSPLDILLPVEWDLTRGVHSNRSGCLIYKEV